jgi:hypothetical protein
MNNTPRTINGLEQKCPGTTEENNLEISGKTIMASLQRK